MVIFLWGGKLDKITEAINDLSILVGMLLIERLDEHDLGRSVVEKTIEKIKSRRTKP